MITSRSFAFVSALGGAAAALALFGAACSSFNAVDIPADAAADVGAGAETSVPTDAGTSDVSVVGNAYCAAHTGDPGFFYCNDFEVPAQSINPFGFSTTAITPTVTKIEVVSDNTRDAVMKVTVDANAAGSHDVSAQQTISAPGLQPFQVDLDIKILTNDAPSVTLAALHFAGADCEAEYGLGAFDGTTLGGTRNRDVPLQSYTAGEWQHVSIALLRDGTASTGFRELVTYGGITIVDREARSSNGADPAECSILGLVLGAIESGSAPEHVTVSYDNVLVRKL
ncbi:MAG: hypothetical protein QOI41_1169 [Myxococcales bacterium]|nr:hypothetical protein [Myxococcales bacterium]